MSLSYSLPVVGLFGLGLLNINTAFFRKYGNVQISSRTNSSLLRLIIQSAIKDNTSGVHFWSIKRGLLPLTLISKLTLENNHLFYLCS